MFDTKYIWSMLLGQNLLAFWDIELKKRRISIIELCSTEMTIYQIMQKRSEVCAHLHIFKI